METKKCLIKCLIFEINKSLRTKSIYLKINLKGKRYKIRVSDHLAGHLEYQPLFDKNLIDIRLESELLDELYSLDDEKEIIKFIFKFKKVNLLEEVKNYESKKLEWFSKTEIERDLLKNDKYYFGILKSLLITYLREKEQIKGTDKINRYEYALLRKYNSYKVSVKEIENGN